MRPPAAPRAASLQKGSEAERRQLTVMFCDLVGSTALSERLDPEELREVLIAYQEACAKVIGRFQGHIAKYLGDGLLVYFGYPVVHEDDAQRAVRAALAILEELARLDARFRREKDISLAARLGVHTGLVVIGDLGASEGRELMAVVGEAPNVAARLQGLAKPNTVVISAATHRLVDTYVVCEPLGAHALKGLSRPIEVYHVLGESGIRTRFDAAVATGLTPLVGRMQEVGLLLDRWVQARQGAGQVVLLSGEPGIGKSRQVQALKERAAAESHALLECQCSPHYQNTALYPVIDGLERVLGSGQDDSAEVKLARLEGMLRRYDLSRPETVPQLASLLSMPLTDAYSLPDSSAERHKRLTFEAVLLLLLRMAAHEPLLFVVEDLHWVDASTLELLDLIVDQVPTTRVLVVLTFRPDFSPPWRLRAHLAHLTLSRLPREHAEVMVERVAGGKSLPDDVLQQLATRTDGVPLFVEELTKAVLESGAVEEREDRYELRGPLADLAIPSTLQDSLLARLDRLGGAKDVAQWGATLGREFTYELLQAVCGLDDVTLQGDLGRLVEAELLYQRGVPPRTTYLFKHALVQETAYESLLRSKRQHYHRRTAQALADRFPEVAESQPELLAYHYTAAGINEQAIEYWERAGRRAIERSASVEAIGHLTRGLELLKGLPDATDRLEQELELQAALGLALMPIKGYGSSEVEAAYTRALELCRQIGETPRLFSVLRGLWEFYDLRGEIQAARELAEELLQVASSMADAGLQVVAHNALGETLLWPGQFARSRDHLERGIALYDPEQHRPLAFQHGGYDSGVICRSWAAHALWYLGYPDQALRRCREALVLAEELSHAHTLAFALTHAAVLHQYRREGQAAREKAEAAIALSAERGFTFWAAFAKIPLGWAQAEHGRVQEGIAQIREGLAGYRATGAELESPLWLGLLAYAYGKVGQTEEGLAALAEGLACASKSGVRFYDAELHRLKGELLLSQSPLNEPQPEACFRRAIDIARRQQAKSLELRAATSLGRLWRKQGKRFEAREILAQVHGWFTEGFDTADWAAAKVALDEAAPPAAR